MLVNKLKSAIALMHAEHVQSLSADISHLHLLFLPAAKPADTQGPSSHQCAGGVSQGSRSQE